MGATPTFPRAMFGLPIIFHFKGNEPKDSTLLPLDKTGNPMDRMASPLILRPYRDSDGHWRAAALLLPSGLEGRSSLQLQLSKKQAETGYPLPIDEQAQRLIDRHCPMYTQKGAEPAQPLNAFLNFFSEGKQA